MAVNFPPAGSEEILEKFLKNKGVRSWSELKPYQRLAFNTAYPKYLAQQELIQDKIPASELSKLLGITEEQLKDSRKLKTGRTGTKSISQFGEKLKEVLGDPVTFDQLALTPREQKTGSLAFYNPPTKNQIEILRNYLPKSGNTINRDILKRMEEMTTGKQGKKFLNILKTKDLSKEKTFTNISSLFPKYTPDEIGTVIARTAQVMDGQEFRGTDFIEPDRKTAKKLFTEIRDTQFDNPLRTAVYSIGLKNIDDELQQGDNLSFRTYRSKINKELSNLGFKNFDVDEIVGVSISGYSQDELVPYSVFSRAIPAALNRKQLAQFQGTFSRYVDQLDSIEGTKNKFKKIDELNKVIEKKEKDLGVKLPKFFKGSAEKAFGKKRFKELTDQGLDFTTTRPWSIKIPEGTMTQKEIVRSFQEGATSDTLKKITEDALTAKGFQQDQKVTRKILSNLKQRGSALPGVLGATAVGAGTIGAAGMALADTDFGDPDTWNMKVGDYLQTGATVAAAAPLATKKGRSIYGKAAKQVLKAAGTPLGLVTANLGFGVDPASGLDRAILGTELALSPLAVKESARFGPRVQRVMNLGLKPATALRYATRFASPIGLLSLAGEGAYQLYKAGQEQQAKIDAMTEEEKQNFLSEQELNALMGEAAEFAMGGRVGFKTGGKGDKRGIKGLESKLPIDPNQPIDPDRRAFMEKMGIGGLGLGALMAGAVKFAPEAAKVVKEAAPDFSSINVPMIVEELYTSIKKLGKMTDYGKKGDVKYEFGPYKMEEGPGGYNITKTNDMGEYGYSEEYFEVYKDPETGVIEYQEATVKPDMDGKMKDIDYGVDAQTYREIGSDLSKATGEDVYKVIAEEDIKGVLDDGGTIIDDGVLRRGD